MVDELPRQVPVVDMAANADGKRSELPENGALLRNVEQSQVRSVWCYLSVIS